MTVQNDQAKPYTYFLCWCALLIHKHCQQWDRGSFFFLWYDQTRVSMDIYSLKITFRKPSLPTLSTHIVPNMCLLLWAHQKMLIYHWLMLENRWPTLTANKQQPSWMHYELKKLSESFSYCLQGERMPRLVVKQGFCTLFHCVPSKYQTFVY